YTIKIESPGFVSFKKTGIELRADTQLRVDVTLQVGTMGGLAILPDSDKSKPILRVLSSPIRAIKRALGVNS
ncbi:MAG TPA: carboxypeptidase-like regulatory domain-containing protein, partial [Blastocatellia bacterium]|nr:carboxypeptidase-like regulatory domain-containing protein [Blastocatellia bacterium]